MLRFCVIGNFEKKKKKRSAGWDAHSREKETCRKRPRSARECAKAHSFLWRLCENSALTEQAGGW